LSADFPKEGAEKNRKVIEQMARLFKEADVKIFDNQLKDKVRAAGGDGDWNKLWPRMLAADTDLGAVLIR
ncbi:MAG: hypothetical protein V2B18_06770, partial [Pseudomonadota bacterium]